MASKTQLFSETVADPTGDFRKLVEEYQQSVFRFARNLIGNEHDAEDITQDVFVAAFNHRNSYDSKQAALQTWLLTIARNQCINYLKRKRPVIDGNVIADASQASKDNNDVRNEFWSRLDEALDSLPIEQKTSFVLAEIEQLPYAEIALIEQTTLGTVKSRIHRAKQRLRTVMVPTLEEH